MLLVALATVALISSQSRNSWLGLVVGLGCAALFSVRWRTLGIGLLGILTIGGMAFLLDLGDFASRSRTVLQPKTWERLGLWMVAIEMWKEAPLLGQGAHTFVDFYPGWLDRVSLPAWFTPERYSIPWAHNLYLESLAERGLLGLSGFVALLVQTGRSLLRDVREPSTRTRAAGTLGGLAAFLAMGVFDLTLMKDWVVLAMLLLAAEAANGDADPSRLRSP
ncbi:MAG: O-antigen ligase family protein [bacterium]|nr:O-antigen ligase family protein [bacterium]